MPIKGLSENRRLPRVGKIHLGIKAQNAKGVEYPKAVDYFVCPPEVQAVFGEKPKELRILIPVEDEERWCSQYYRLYSKTRGLVCKGDGEVALRMVDSSTGEMVDKESKDVVMREVLCKGRECPDYRIKCKEIMNLQFILPEVPGLGIWQIDTGSINSIININSAAELVRRAYGRVSMIPLLLTLEPQAVKSPVDGAKKTVYILNLRTRSTMIEISQSAKGLAALLPGDGEVEMPEPDDEIPELIIPQNQEPIETKPSGGKQVATGDKPAAVPPAQGAKTKPQLITELNEANKTLKWTAATLRTKAMALATEHNWQNAENIAQNGFMELDAGELVFLVALMQTEVAKQSATK